MCHNYTKIHIIIRIGGGSKFKVVVGGGGTISFV